MTKSEKRAVVTNLKKARKILSDPKHWIKGQLFGDKDGNFVPSRFDYKSGKDVAPANAATFCSLGAIQRANGKGEAGAKRTLARAISMLFYKKVSTSEERVYVFNDKKSTQHDQILAAFDKAIELAQAEADAA